MRNEHFNKTKPLTIEQLRSYQKNSPIYIVDFENNTTYPPHKTERVYIVLDNDEKLLVVGAGYSWFQYADYGTKWLAYKIEKI